MVKPKFPRVPFCPAWQLNVIWPQFLEVSHVCRSVLVDDLKRGLSDFDQNQVEA